jgi:hypothetical protein
MSVKYATEQKQVKEGRGDDPIISKVRSMVDESAGAVTEWNENQKKWYKLRMRVKKAKSFPFANCSNIRMPTLEIFIRKIKASLVNIVYSIRPVVQVVPNYNGSWEIARKIEKFLDHLVVDIIGMEPKSVILADRMLEQGFYLAKPYWRLEITTRIEDLKIDDLPLKEVMWLYSLERTEDEIIEAVADKVSIDRNDYVWAKNYAAVKEAVKKILSGTFRLKIEVDDVIYNFPDVAFVEPSRFYVPTSSGYNPKRLQYGVHEFFLSMNEVEARINNGWDADAVAKIKSSKNKTSDDYSSLDEEKDSKEGIERLNRDNQIRIWESYCWHDVNGDKKEEKCVLTVAPDFNVVLRGTTLPEFSGNFPIVKLFYELRDDRWFAHRPLAEILEDIVKEIDIQHMQKIDRQTLTNSPLFLYRAGMVNPQTTQFIFGQGIPVHGMTPLNDVMADMNRHNPNVDFSYEREQMILESKATELVGQTDYTLQSMINRRQPRTRGEVDLQAMSMQNVFSLDARMFKTSHEELFNWIWELWCQYGDDDYEFAYFGKDGWEKIKISKEESQGRYKITIRGNDQNSNPQVRIQKAQMVMESQTNPIALQMGIITPNTMVNAYKRFYQELDIQNAEEFYEMPKPRPPSPPEKSFPKFKDLKDTEQAQILSQLNIKPDMQTRAFDKMSEKQAEQDEQELKEIQVALEASQALTEEEENEETTNPGKDT